MTDADDLIPVPVPFVVETLIWDQRPDNPNGNPDLMWIVVKSKWETTGEYQLDVRFGVGESAPINPAQFAAYLMTEADNETETTTLTRGIEANRCAFGLPWLAGRQGVRRGQNVKIEINAERLS